MNSVIEKIRVNGIGLRADLAEQISGGQLKLSVSSVTAFDFTIIDRPGLNLTKASGELFQEGTTILWEDYALSLASFETGGGTDAPIIEVSATSDFVNSLKKETGGKSWDGNVSAFANEVIKAKGATPYVQPALGEREIKREEPPGDHRDAQNTWDVLAEMAKQTGSWLFEYGNRIVLARPSWLVAQPGIRRFKIVWNSWTDHSDALAAAPQYSWDKDAKPYDGKEQLTIKAVDPGAGSVNALSQARPGDIIDFSGSASPSPDPMWIIREVSHSLVTGQPVTIKAWRPVDPPEIMPASDEEGEGGSSAGVPNGPLGSGNWQGEQLKNAAEIVREGQRQNLDTLAMELAVMTAMGESSLRNKDYGDNAINPDGTMNDSIGLFQQQERFDTGGHSRSDRLSPGKSAGIFYTALKKTPYKDTYNNGGPSVIHGGYYGPGKSANSASLAVHNIQRNQVPTHYAHLWADAQLIVRECIAAGKDSENSGGGGKATGPLGSRIDSLMKSYEMRSIDVDGAFGAQCVDLAAKYITDLKGISMVRGNGVDYWRHPGLMGSFTAVSAGQPPRKGDVVSWSGVGGAYPNGGYGHVAIYSHSFKGTDFFLSQNPGPSRTQPLSRLGVLGWMRPKA